MSSKSQRKSAVIVLTILLSFCFALRARSERLPLKTYSAADGLASSVIHHIAHDSKTGTIEQTLMAVLIGTPITAIIFEIIRRNAPIMI